MADQDITRQQAPRSQAEIQADLAAARDRLSSSVEDLIDQVHPVRIKQRQIDGLKQMANAEIENAKAQILDEDGKPRIDRIAVAAGAVAGFVTFVVIIRAIVRRGKKK